jgi:hypothetical protein
MAHDDDELDDLIDDLEEKYPELDRDELEAIAESILDARDDDDDDGTPIDDLYDFIGAFDDWDGYYDEYDVEASPSYGEDT